MQKHNEVQDMLTQTMTPWFTKYFNLKELEKIAEAGK